VLVSGPFRCQLVASSDLGVQKYEYFLTFQLFLLKILVAFSSESATGPVPFGLGVQKYYFILRMQGLYSKKAAKDVQKRYYSDNHLFVFKRVFLPQGTLRCT